MKVCISSFAGVEVKALDAAAKTGSSSSTGALSVSIGVFPRRKGERKAYCCCLSVNRTMFSSSAKCPFSIILSASSITKNRNPRILAPSSSSCQVSSCSGRFSGAKGAVAHRLHEIPQSTGSSHQYIAAPLQHPLLLLCAQTTNDGPHADTRWSGFLLHRQGHDAVEAVHDL